LPFPRFYPILDSAALAARGLAVTGAADALLAAGVRILQLRHKGAYSREVFAAAETIARLAREAGATFIVNDRADIALLVDAGLHVGQDDLPPADARRVIGAGRTIGFSTHNEEQMREALAEPVDYVAFGPVYPTASKANPDPVVGLARLRRIRAMADRPLIAIGGITRERSGEVLAHGADSIAVIGDLYEGCADAAALRRRAEEWLAAVAS
jgi:thiamine-phosphate pyrophosphorylase